MINIILACSPGIDLSHFGDNHILIAIDTRLIGPGQRPTPNARWWCGGVLKQHFLVPLSDFTNAGSRS